MILKRINFHRFRGFWLKNWRNGLRKYLKWLDPLNLIPVKFLYFSQRKKIFNISDTNIYVHIHYYIYRYTHVITSRNFRLNKRGDWRRQQPKWNLTLNKRWNWSSCTKLALSASWTHGLIAQSVRASERNSVVVDSNPTQASFL